MVKGDIVCALCDRGYYKDQANEVIDDVFEIIREAMIRGETVKIRGFGTFGTKIRKGRWQKNVATGRIVMSKDCRVSAFHPCDGLKEAVRDWTGED